MSRGRPSVVAYHRRSLLCSIALGCFCSIAEASGGLEVAADGSGGAFTTIQGAIDAAPDGGTEPTIIHVAEGQYVEKLTVPATKGPIVLVGDGRDATVIEFDESHYWSGYWVATRLLTNYANDLVIRALTVHNLAGEPGGSGGKWDAAVENYGDRLILDDVRLRADHDTLLMYGRAFGAGPGPSRVYVHDSLIQGRGDFVASFTSAFIERSVLETIRDRSQILWQQGIHGVAPAAQDALAVRNTLFTGLSTDPYWPAGVTNLYEYARVYLIGNVFEFDLGANRPVVHFVDSVSPMTSALLYFGNSQNQSTLSPLIWDVYSVPGSGVPRLNLPVSENAFGEPIVGALTAAAAAAVNPLWLFGNWDPRATEPRLACEDGLDNDRDGLTDLLDPGCASAEDVSELTRDVACDNGLDDDGDGLVDLADVDCGSPSDTSEAHPWSAPGCGIGPELAALIPVLWALRKRSRPARA